MRRRRRVLLTGATGNWGRAALRELRDRDRVDVVALVRPASRDSEALREFRDMPNLTVVRGDLTEYADVARAVEGVDCVLHLGGLVSPAADADPRRAWRTNVGSVRHLVRAVRSAPDPSRIELVGVGSVAETGDRPAPHHWGRVGDPIRVSRLDEYGQTKVAAERLLVDAGLPRWAWLRQTGILHPGIVAVRDPIMTHVPLDGVLEWVSDTDSARLVAGIAEGAPEAFWGAVYNVGGGEGWRMTNWRFQEALGRAMGVRDMRAWFRRDWFATGNFHGHWYTDSDALEALVPFRRDDFGSVLDRAVRAAPAAVRRAGAVPGWIVRRFVTGPLARRERGTLGAVRRGDLAAIAAHFGSLEDWRRIGDWSTYVPAEPSRTPSRLDHGYDEAKPSARWAAADYRAAAAFRGGELLSGEVATGDVASPLLWRCAFGHVFGGSPRLVLTAGHWCPECVRDPEGYAEQAERNPFLAQLEPSARAADTG